MFEDFKNRLSSLDIETTGLDERTDKIWSIGLDDGGAGKEYFSDPGMPLGKGSFFEEQKARKSFDAWEDASKMSDAKAVDKLFQSIDKDSIVLIQNLNFENKMIGEVINNMPAEEQSKFAEKMMYVSDKHKGKLLYSPPQVASMRTRAAYDYRQFMSNGDSRSFDDAAKGYSDMMQEYSKHAGKKGQGAFVIELMDITKATYAQAASKGLLDKRNINIGTRVEYLTDVLGLGEEKHTALSDAKQQKQIFERLTTIQGELSSGNISDLTRKQLTKIRVTQPYEGSKQFASAIKNTLEEIQTQGYTRQLGGMLDFESTNVVGVQGPDGRHSLVRPMYGKAKRTSDKNKAIQHVLERFRGADTKGINKVSLVGEVIGAESIDDAISLLDKRIEGLKGKSISVSNFVDVEAPTFDQLAKRASIEIEDKGIRAAEILQGTSTKQRVGIGAGIAALGLGAMALTGKGDADKKQREEERDRDLSLNQALSEYKYQTGFHGSGFADWNDRTQHHRYG